MGPLPDGPRGRFLAVTLALLTVFLVAAGIIAPLWSWHEARVETLERRQAVALRMTALAESLPALRAAKSAPGAGDRPVLLEGTTDSIASANLLSLVQSMAGAVGARLASIETLPGETLAGAVGYRRIILRVSVAAPWNAMVGLLQALDQASPRILVDDMKFRALIGRAPTEDASIDGTLTIVALRAGGTP